MRVAVVKPLHLLLLFPSLHRTSKNANSHITITSRISPPKNLFLLSTTPTKTLESLFSRRLMATAATSATSQPPPPSVQVREKIELTDIEKKIFDRLLGTLRHFGLRNQLRVAGGWVRDKVHLFLLLLLLLVLYIMRKKMVLICWILVFSASRERML